MFRNSFVTLVLLLFTFGVKNASAWGGRGHAAICEAAAFLVKEEGLGSYLRHKPHVIGHLCNIPDTYWRSLGGDANKLGSPTHYINAEVLGVKLKDVPSDYRTIITTFTGKPNQAKESSNIFSVPEELGSNWWRADQFYRRAGEAAKLIASSEAPKNSKEEQDEKLAYNRAVYDMVVNMGLMGHFVGDASQPLHNTTDYDGYAANHGGIHAYYEDTVVGEFDGDLTALVMKKARGMKKASFLHAGSVIENMRQLSDISAGDLRQIIKLDPVTRQSTLKIEKGVSFKVAAERASAKAGWGKFNKMITEQMARAALLLAQSWDQVYVQAGRPKMGNYKSYRFPFTVEFVAPDYFDVGTENTKK